MEVRNNVQSPNFGMALRIPKTQKMADALNELPKETLKEIIKAGEILGREGEENATKFYHVKINEDLSCKLEADKDAFFGLFKTDKYFSHYGQEIEKGQPVTSKRVIMISNNVGDIAGVARYVPLGETQPFFNVWGAVNGYSSINDITPLTKVAKILDDVAAEKAYQKTLKLADDAAEKAEKSKLTGNILDNYGI